MSSSQEYEFDIALSFAGEDRGCAAEIAEKLKASGVKVFYDDFEKSDLWGKNLYDHLADVYSSKANYCIMIISASYAEKAWTNHERQAAQARAFKEHREYILPVRLDDTEIPGIHGTVGYLDLRVEGVDGVVNAAMAKLGKDTAQPSEERPTSIPMPKIKVKITQRDRDKFLQSSYECIKNYFGKGIAMLQSKHKNVEGDLQEIDSRKFIAKLYVNGDRKSQCKIWIGGISGDNQIALSLNDVDMMNENSMNDWLSVEEADEGLTLKTSGFNFSNTTRDKPLDKNDGAEYLWNRFIEPLQY